MANSNDERDNRANQFNPNNDAYWDSRGDERPESEPSYAPTQDDLDNYSRQLDPEHDTYRKSRDE